MTFHTYQPMNMEQTEFSETSAYKIQKPGNYPEENIQHTEHGESLKSRKQVALRHKKTPFLSLYISHTHTHTHTTGMARLKKIYWLETKVVASEGQLVRTDWFERIRGWAMYVLGFIVIKSNKKICGTNAGCKSKYWKRSWVIHKLWSINRLKGLAFEGHDASANNAVTGERE